MPAKTIIINRSLIKAINKKSGKRLKPKNDHKCSTPNCDGSGNSRNQTDKNQKTKETHNFQI